MQTVISFDGDDLSEYRILLLDHAVERNRVVIDHRVGGVFGRFLPVGKDAFSHRIERDESDEQCVGSGGCRCRVGCDVDGNQGGSCSHEEEAARLGSMLQRADDVIDSLRVRIDHLLIDHDRLEAHVSRLETDLAAVRADREYMAAVIVEGDRG